MTLNAVVLKQQMVAKMSKQVSACLGGKMAVFVERRKRQFAVAGTSN